MVFDRCDSGKSSRVAIGELEGLDWRESGKGVGGVDNGEVRPNIAHGKIVPKGVEREVAIGADTMATPSGVVACTIIEDVFPNTVGHVDVAIPGALQTARARSSLERERGVVIIRGERTGLETTVKSQNTERIGVGVGQVEVFGTQIGGVGASPDGIVVAARGTHADVVAHDVGVGAGIPTETETSQESVHTTKAKTTGRGGEIVLEEKTAGVGIECDSIIRSGEAGCGYVIMNRVGTDYAVEGVDIMGVG